jgi:hypothetical protein
MSDEAVLGWLDGGDPERDPYVAGRLALMLGTLLGPLSEQGRTS